MMKDLKDFTKKPHLKKQFERTFGELDNMGPVYDKVMNTAQYR
jgi:hypothetical protein